MARPRNYQEEDRIYRCGYRLLLEKGYRAASYQAIADSAGESRGFVQHYLPKKEQLLERFIEELLRLMDEWVLAHRLVESLFENLALTGQLYYAFLFDERTCALALDMLRDRGVSRNVIEANTAYQAQKAAQAGVAHEVIAEEVVRIMGGSYELCYWRLCEGRPADPLAESLHNVEAYAALVGEDPVEIIRTLPEQALSKDEIDQALSEIREAIVAPS